MSPDQVIDTIFFSGMITHYSICWTRFQRDYSTVVYEGLIWLRMPPYKLLVIIITLHTFHGARFE